MLGVSVQWDKDQPARKFVHDSNIAYPVGRDASGSIGQLYSVDATPTSLFIDKTGRLVEQHVGEMEETEFTTRIESLLKK